MEKAIAALYDAALSSGDWNNAFQAINSLTQSAGLHFAIVNKKSFQPVLSSTQDLPTDVVDFYTENLLSKDVRINQLKQHPRRRLTYDFLHSTEDEIQNDEVYNWRLEGSGHKYYSGVFLHQIPEHFGFLALQRTPSQGHVQANDLKTLKAVSRHLDRAVETSFLLDQNCIFRHLDYDSLDSQKIGVVLFDGKGRILIMNDKVRSFIARRDGLVCDGTGLWPLKAADKRTVSSDFARLINYDRDTTPVRSVSKTSGPRPYLVRMVGLAHEKFRLLSNSAVLMLVQDTAEQKMLDTEGVRAAYGLTARELEAAEQLWQGHSLKDVSETMRIKLPTVRTHIQHIYRKMNTENQAQLLSVLSGFSN